MTLFAVAALVLGFATPAFPQYSVIYDTFYDGTQGLLSSTACSTGENGLITYGYNTFAEIPSYPYLGGSPQITSWDSPFCGTCWSLTYSDPHGNSASVNFTAINTSGNPVGFAISLAGMEDLTNGNSLTLDDEILITAALLPASSCGL